MKEKIIEILEKYNTDTGHWFNAITSDKFEDIADEIVKILE